MFVRVLLLLIIGTASTCWAQTRVQVGVELVLAVDSSISVSDAEYHLQMQGIARALRHPDILRAVQDQPGGVAVTLVHWSLGSRNRQAVGWHRLRDAADVMAFAEKVAAAPRRGAGRGTSISDAITYSARLFAQNTFAGQQLKIDISGDSRHNSGPSPGAARDLAVLAGITINGLVIEDGDRGLAGYYRAHVAGGPGAFVMSVARHGDFARAMRRKLARELAPVAADRPPKADQPHDVTRQAGRWMLKALRISASSIGSNRAADGSDRMRSLRAIAFSIRSGLSLSPHSLGLIRLPSAG